VFDEIEKKAIRPLNHDYSDSKVLLYQNMENKRGIDLAEIMEKNVQK
jgi:hypothetical protein